jgi:Geranylgeranyl pyrophosphate synthase
MGTVVQLKKQLSNSYTDLRNSVEDKLILVEEKITSKLRSSVDLVDKMTKYHIKTGGKRLRCLLTLGSAKLCGYSKGGRDINLAACVELIHAATLMHDDVIDSAEIRRGKKTLNTIWGNQSSILVGDYLLSRCFEMMVEDGNLEILRLLSSTSSEIAQGEVLQLQHKGEVDMLEETYLKIISSKTASLFAAATKVGAILGESNLKYKEALEFYGKNLGLTFQIADDKLDYNSDLKLLEKK